MKKKYPNTKRNYRTDIDLFLAEFNAKRVQEPIARQQEIAKHQWIANRRDHAVDDPKTDIWEDF
jgi:hypothetical protein